MATTTIVKGFRIRKQTLENLNKIRVYVYGNKVKLNGMVQEALDQYISRELPKTNNNNDTQI
jgi:hypothetical protein